MKKLVLIIAIIVFAMGLSTNVYSQQPCVPDEACIDTADPGQICPIVFPNGYVNVPYELTLTFRPYYKVLRNNIWHSNTRRRISIRFRCHCNS